eukprot:7433568-Lingulodinium_polyedra.AAC.1
MRQGGAWVDAAFLHALGRAYGADVLIFQARQEAALVGEDMLEGMGDGSGTPCLAPVVLANDHQFWGS